MRQKIAILVLFVAIASTAFARQNTRLPFIYDDYGKALSLAKQQNKPIFVECWAPW